MGKVLVTYSRGDEGIWKSDKIRAVSQEDKVAGLGYLHLLGLGSEPGELGCFQLNPGRMAASISYAFPGVTEADVATWIPLYERHGLLISYEVVHNGKTTTLGAWTNYRRPGRFPEKRRWPAPPGVLPMGAKGGGLINVPGDGEMLAAADGEGSRRDSREVSAEVREVIDLYVAVWEPRILVRYSMHNARAIERSLGKRYDVKTLKAAVFVAKYGPHDWYREHNHDLEYLTRPSVVEQIFSRNENMHLSSPAIATAAIKHQMHAILVECGFALEGGRSRPGPAGQDFTGSAERLRQEREKNKAERERMFAEQDRQRAEREQHKSDLTEAAAMAADHGIDLGKLRG